jgi:ubiquinone biosynthesis monooxygenase Coq7
MQPSLRQLSFVDRLIGQIDQGLRTLVGKPLTTTRPHPAAHLKKEEVFLLPSEKREVVGLMRINHAGEVAAQALYQGQALTAGSSQIRACLQQSALEENDHLDWCAGRLEDLGSHTSYLNPLWYLGSLAIGVAAGLAGDRWSLGFVVETERQVVTHLEEHLTKLPQNDTISNAILEQMKADEGHHASVALEAGGVELPAPIKFAMGLISKVMTKTAYFC